MRYCFASLVGVLLLAGAVNADVIWYDSNGFEQPTFVPGPLNGQDGWVGTSAGSGIPPMVVTPPDPVLDDQAVRLEIADVQGDVSSMQRPIADPLAAGWPIVRVSFDIYRDEPIVQNLWWWWFDAGTPTYGLQWDQSQATHPFGWNPGAGQRPTVFGRYANLTMEWDFLTNTTTSWYDGVLVDIGIPMPVPPDITQLTGWAIELSHDADTGTGAEVVWIDNFVITVVPEPTSLTLLGLGLVGLLRRR